ncbi:MAG: sugar transferase [Phycisphaerales bacterium]|nr:MAG: sugar transferase [Phycisphaerales bacterium]
MIPLFIDSQVSYLSSSSGGGSLLRLPVGAGVLLDHLAAPMGDDLDGDVLIMPTFAVDASYERSVQASVSGSVRVIRPDELPEVLAEYEPSDYLLVVDPVRWPVNGFNFGATIRRLHEYRGVSHAIAVGGGPGGYMRERVERDGDGQVKRVQRFYSGVTWPEAASTAIFASLVPARSASGVRFESLPEMRAALSAKGVLGRDVPVASDVVALTEERGLLALNEHMLMRGVQRNGWPGFSIKQAGILVGRGCQIHASARLVGPVIIHDGVTVEEGATIVGPTVVGRGCRIGCGATIAQSILADCTVATAGVTILHEVVSGRRSMPGVGAGACLDRAPAARRRTGIPRENDGCCAYLEVHDAPARRPVHQTFKRAMDVVLSAVALVLLSPLLVITAILIKRSSPGPVLFVHRRESKGGKEFPCLKFRTMTSDAHRRQRELYKVNELDGPQFKVRDDPRVTRLGERLRSTNIDELPQLINVLLGHMSLVGPRPSPFRENQVCVPWRRARLSVRPGITGLWQICRSGDRTQGDFHEWIYYDIAYVRHFSIWLDIKILVATVLSRGGRRRVPLARMVRGARGAASGRTERRLKVGA